MRPLTYIVLVFLAIVVAFLVYTVFFKKKSSSRKHSAMTSGASTGVTSWMGDNDWILQIKLGTGGDNCTHPTDAVNSCRYLYASSTQPALKLVKDVTVDSDVTDNPTYQFYNTTKGNKWVSWNDGADTRTAGTSSCPTGHNAKGAAHDKGTLVTDSDMSKGVYLQHSNPNWGCFKGGFLATCDDGATPGVQTQYAQHLLFVKLNKPDISDLITLMTNSNLCATQGSGSGDSNPFSDFKPFSGAVPQGDYMNKTLSSGLVIYSKPNRDKGDQDDPWAYLNQELCGGKGMYALTYCSPPCPDHDKVPVGGITDVLNTHHDRKKDARSAMTISCVPGLDVSHVNHAKLGVCIDSGSKSVIGGNNHSPPSQGDRGGLFVVIDNSKLADGFRCLFK